MHKANVRHLIVAILGAATAAAALPTQAQEASAMLEEITVTAQRREQSLQDVPGAVSALTGDALNSAGIARVSDLANAVPNLYINAGYSVRTTVISVRGISSNPNNPGVDPAVGVFVDGVYMTRPTTINSALYDLERIEFLRGPQGSLYGKNTIAGAINMITRMPTAELGGEVRLGFGNHGSQMAYAALSGPLGSERLTARLSGSYQQRDGLDKNLYTGTEMNDVDELAGRLTLAFTASDDLQLVLRADASSSSTNTAAVEILDNGDFTGAPFADADPYDREVAYDRDPNSDRDLSGLSLQVDWTTALGEFTSITAFRRFDWVNLADNDFSVLNLLSTGISEDQQQFTQEFRLVSPTDQPFEYVAGLYYEDQSLDTVSRALIGPDLGIYPDEVNANIFADVSTNGWAAYVQGTYHFSPAWSLTGGLRYTSEDKDVEHYVVGDPFEVLLPSSPLRKLTRSDQETTPSVSLNWQASDSVLTYLSYAEGFKAGGFNVFSITPTDDSRYEPEQVESIELGVKSMLAGGRVRLNVAVYTLDYKDLQVNQLVLVSGVPTFQTSNAATASSTGAEVELEFQATEALLLTAAYGYNDAEFDSFENATAQGDDYSGNTLPLAASNTLNASLQYSTAVGAGMTLQARLEANWRDRVFFDADNDPVATQDAYTTVDARVTLAAKSGWSVSAWGRNLTDKDYALDRGAGVIVPGQYTHTLAPPRLFGIEFGYAF